MLNPFPILLSFGLLAPFLLRIVVGIFFLKTGVAHLKINKHTTEDIVAAEKKFTLAGPNILWFVATVEALCGIALIVGFLTQIASLVLAILLVIGLSQKKFFPDLFAKQTNFSLLLLAILISLMFSGAGFLAFDLPL
jgi:uncharacterized membrane protein YphA (DoxX/SURF4 family)